MPSEETKKLVFHIWSIYDYHFIINELAYKLKKQFRCLGEEITKNISYIL